MPRRGWARCERGRSKISNLPWVIDAREVAKQLRLNSVGLLNDLEAYAYGIDGLESKDFITLSEGAEEAEGNRAVISAKTGLGMAGLYWDGFRHHPFACEGGHADFAPRNELQMELLAYLQKKYGRISCERILSGPGIKNIYDFLRDTNKAEEPEWLRTQMSTAPDPPALISQTGVGGQGRDLRSDPVDLRQRVRRGDRELRVEFHVHGGNFYRRQHRGENRAQDEGSRVPGILPG